MRKEEEEAVLKTIPCVVYTRADSSHTTFFRGVVAHFDKMTARFALALMQVAC